MATQLDRRAQFLAADVPANHDAHGQQPARDGTINATGVVRLATNVDLRGHLNVQSSSSNVQFAGGGRSLIHENLTATVAGLGAITVNNGSIVNLENGSLVAVDTANAGRLEVGFFISEVTLNFQVPAAATVRGEFSQTTQGEFAVDLGGPKQSSEYDLLEVIGTARLNGVIEATLIDGFVPAIGNIFRVLTATQVIGEFDHVETHDAGDLLGFVLTDIYSPTDVVLRVADVFLIGDYNDDEVVDAADYTMWRDLVGASAGSLPNDIDGGPIGPAQYETWRSHFGNTLPSTASLNNATVPEPTTAMLLMVLIATSALIHRRELRKAESLLGIAAR